MAPGRRSVRRRVRRRRRRREKGSPLLKRLAIGVALLLPILYFVFTKVFFDPFEEPQIAFNNLVPRNVDIYLRRQRLDKDFGVFPSFEFFERLAKREEFVEMEATSWWEETGFSASWNDIAVGAREFVSNQDLLDPVADLLGSEVVYIGRSGKEGLGNGGTTVLLRLSQRGKAAHEALLRDFAREEILPGSLQILQDDPDIPSLHYWRLELPGGAVWFHQRVSDLLVLGTDEKLVRDVLATRIEGVEQSLGYTRLYTEHLPAGPPDPAAHFSAEVLFEMADENSASGSPEGVQPSQDALENILLSLADPTLLETVIGRVEEKEGVVSGRFHLELDRRRTTEEKKGLLGTRPFDAGEALSKAFASVPFDTAFLVRMEVDLGRMLRTVGDGFEPALQKLINDTLRNMARYSSRWEVDSVRALAAFLDRALGDHLTVVVRPLDHEVPEGSQPFPAVAFLVDVEDPALWTSFEDTIIRAHREFGVERMFKQDEGVGVRKWLELEGVAVEEISFVQLDESWVIVGTDDDLVREMVAIYVDSRRSLGERPEVQDMAEGMRGRRANLVAYVDTKRLGYVLEPYGEWIGEEETRVDLTSLRLVRQKKLIASDYSEWRTRIDEMPKDLAAELQNRLDEIVLSEEAQRKSVAVPAFAQEWWEGFSWIGVFEGGVFTLRVGERDGDFSVAARTILAR